MYCSNQGITTGGQGGVVSGDFRSDIGIPTRDIWNLKTLVLNADYRPLIVVMWKRAFVMVYEGRATEVECYDEVARDGRGNEYTIPSVISMHYYVNHNRLKVPCTRRNILIRDNFTCQYCGNSSRHLTLDHVIPKSRWTGDSSPTCWTNLVAACKPCNERKSNLTCEESGMWPYTRPVMPTYGLRYLGVLLDRAIPNSWLNYLEL